MAKTSQTKKQFPIFKTNKKLVYLDSASTTQTPQIVLDAMNEYYTKHRANVHRGIYTTSIQATQAFEASRASLASFINAKPEEIIFTSGTTHALNQLAYSLAPRLSHRDNVVLTRLEHHANLVPWQQMAKHYGFELRFIELKKENSHSVIPAQAGIHDTGFPIKSGMTSELHIESAKKLIDENTKIVSFTLASNVTGTITPAEEIIKLAKKYRAITIIDAAQAIAHMPIDVKKLDCDFLAFSGHKMYGPTGIGVLYGKKVMLEEHLEPFFFGGEMVKEVTYQDTTWNDVPWKFEAGTPNIAGAIGLGAAVKFIQEIGWEEIQKHENELTNKLISELTKHVTIVGARNCHSERSEESLSQSPDRQRSFADAQDDKTKRVGVVSFTVPGVHPHDIAEILNQEGICVRAGFHCAEPLHKYLGLNQGTVRASLGIYNTEKDIEKLMAGIKKAKKIFKV